MTQDPKQSAHAIITYYQTQYKKIYNSTAVVNRNKLQNLIVNILKDLSVQDIKKLIDFYLSTDKHPSLTYFCYEYDEILDRMKLEEADLDHRKALLKQTQKNVEEFRRRYGAGK